MIACYNEREVLPLLRARLVPVLEEVARGFEVIFVDDGSIDGSSDVLDDIARDHRFKVIHFSRNFGQQAAFTAGIQEASGSAVVLMDCDLQDPPELIRSMVARWREGYQVVYAVRQGRKESWIKRTLYALFYRTLKAAAEIDTPLDSGDFSLMDRRVVEVLLSLPERNRFLRGLRAWVGFRQTAVLYERPARAAGDTKYSLRKLFRLAISGYVGFSLMPLRLAVLLGMIAALLGMALGTWSVVLKLIGDPTPQGWTSLFSAVLFVGGVQLLVMGILGEYVGRVYDEVRRRPMYVVRERVGFDQDLTAGIAAREAVLDEFQ